jgi:hypothetical protein
MPILWRVQADALHVMVLIFVSMAIMRLLVREIATGAR